MTQTDEILRRLVALSRRLAQPELDYLILAEGNTSARIDEESFWVKASGFRMADIDAGGFVAMRTAPLLATLEEGNLSDDGVKARMAAARVDPAARLRPSVEAMLHAVALTVGGAHYVGHTHPSAVNAILCSRLAEEAYAGRLFPDEIVICGPAPVYVPYTDPGLPLAREVRRRVVEYVEARGEPPKVILMQNHGLVALGRDPEEVEAVTAMAVKTARVLLGAFALGGPNFLSEAAAARIHTRPDELYRRQLLKGQGG
ncbi:MAG: class II aldolase/adducin family protein [Anaerolineae bacterium]|nr:class II aldolase/adducin family protein [Anaerolineae bacterium]